MSEDIRHIETGRVNVLQRGQGPDVLVLHSGGTLPLGMEAQIFALSDAGFRVTAPNIYDLVREADEPTFKGVVDVLKNLDVLNDPYAVRLVGCSLGGGVALQYALEHPQVDRLTLGSSVGWPLRRSLFAWLKEFRKFQVLTATIPKEILQKDKGAGLIVAEMARNPRGVLKGFILAGTADLTREMPLINTPVDLLATRSDEYVPAWSVEAMSTLLPNSQFRDVNSPYGHMWYHLEPEKLNDPALRPLGAPLVIPGVA